MYEWSSTMNSLIVLKNCVHISKMSLLTRLVKYLVLSCGVVYRRFTYSTIYAQKRRVYNHKVCNTSSFKNISSEILRVLKMKLIKYVISVQGVFAARG